MRAWVLGTVLCMALAASPLCAQRGGGGGGHGGAFGGGFGGAHGAAGFAGHPTGFGGHSVVNGWNGGRGNGWGWRGNNWVRFSNGWYRYPYRNWGWGYPYYGYVGWYPWWGWDDFDYDNDSSYYPSNYYPPPGYGSYPPGYPPQYGYVPPSGSAASYASQDEVAQIQQQVAQLRAQQEQRYSPQPIATTLVFRDGHTENVTNYAIAGSTLWIFNEDRARKVPLAELNLPATKRESEEHGSEFVVPNAR